MTLIYTIKYKNVGFIQCAIHEVCIIFQALLRQKSKYAKIILR